MISVVIPICNEEETLPHLDDRLRRAARLWEEDYEVVFVDDGSTDRSLELMMGFAGHDPAIRVVKLSRNFGHQAAISAGIHAAVGDAVVVMDGDLQDPPEEISRFLEKWREGYEVVHAVRTERKEGLLKRAAYAIFYRLLYFFSDIDMPLDAGDFCVMDRKVVDVMKNQMPEQIRFVRGLRAYAGFKQIGVRYPRSERAAGRTKYTFGRLTALAVDGLFGFSMMPLRMASYLGVLVAIPSFLVGIYFILHRVVGFPVFGHFASESPGLATLAVGLFFLCGLILIMLGVVGEYIGRIYLEVKRRPFYIVDTVFDVSARAGDLDHSERRQRLHRMSDVPAPGVINKAGDPR